MSALDDRDELLAGVNLGQLLEELAGIDRRGHAFPCPNPGHDQTGRTPPVSLGERDGHEVWNCHACGFGGTAIDALMLALGVGLADSFDALRERAGRPRTGGSAARTRSRPRVVAAYDYTDEARKLLFQVVRREDKTFPQRRPNGSGGWIWGLADTRRVLYRLPQVLDAVKAGKAVYVTEGEKDADALVRLGLFATCNPGGAGCWRPEYADCLRGARVALLADKDKPGREHALDIARSLDGAAAVVRIGEAAAGKDVSDHLAAGRGLDELVRVSRKELEAKIAEAAPDATEAASGEVAAAERAEPQPAPVDAVKVAEKPRREVAATRSWPAPLEDAAFHGLVGEIARTIEPHTEADPAAVLVSLLVAFGNVIGRRAGFKIGGTFHATNLYALLVGPTSSGRKGTAGDEATRVFEMVDPQWTLQRVASGLSTGEGLVWQVRDPITNRRKAKKGDTPNLPDGWLEEVHDPGEEDKRLLVVEAEFAQALKVMRREGNTLSPTVRRLWDRGDARSMVKTLPGSTTGALVSIVGHISAEELRRQLSDTEIENGFVNRFMIVCSRRSKRLPFGGNLSDGELAKFAPRLREAIDQAQRCRELGLDEGARAVWPAIYRELDGEQFGILGAVLRRAVPIVRRLAVIYALLDSDSIVRDVHPRAAVAVWRHCVGSARFVFGDAVGSRVADKVRDGLRTARGEWVPREQIRVIVGSNAVPAEEIEAALALLLDYGLAERKTDAEPGTRGRPPELWRSTEAWEEWEENGSEVIGGIGGKCPADPQRGNFLLFPPNFLLRWERATKAPKAP